MKLSLAIRKARKEDIPQILQLCEAHAAYEKAEYYGHGKADRLSRDLFGKSPKLSCLVVVSEGRLLGYATYMVQYSTWDAAPYLYLDCLYLKEIIRGMGVGSKIFKELRKVAVKEGCFQLQWQTPEFNTGAIGFYRAQGAVSKRKYRFFLESSDNTN
ncbi:GNAT family N-acetyltransferase [Poritiphilus flavus]|uniref:GNAT family N-acetyltransferase n=1 Tax=Poritiphilus flavus TaxID=2697053 RepID=A0A6L9E7Z3_9FLAO|nr:GNAT family N-acetyltransferase [Poritiphilus flavus]NAS10721.1 GNAT family N-acetyltransferase [Poritiphilus flavus]